MEELELYYALTRSPVSKEYYEREFMVTLMNKFPDVSKEYSNYHKYPRTLDCFNLTMERYPFMKKFVKIKECDSRSLDLAGEIFDFALIDGDHTYDGVKNDHERLASHLKTGGLVAFHDNSVHFPGVQQYISEVSKMNDLEKIGEAGHLVVFKKIR